MKIYEELKSFVNMKEHESDDKPKPDIPEYKILVLGDMSVGKTSICERFCFNEFSLEIKPSTKIDCYPKMVQIFDKLARIYLIDIPSKLFDSVVIEIINDVKGVILVYDITKSKTIESIDNWIDKIKKKIGSKIPTIILGNKNDLTYLRNIDKDEAIEKAENLKCEFMEVSCIDNCEVEPKSELIDQVESVQEAIKLLIAKIYYLNLSDKEKEKFQNIEEDNENNNK